MTFATGEYLRGYFIASYPEQNILHLLLPQVIDEKSIDHVILKDSEVVKRDLVGNSLLFKVRRFLKPAYLLLLRRISSIDNNTYKVMVPTMDKNMNLLCANIVINYKMTHA